ncbi:MAG: hypothetical protein ACFB9M_17335 [Myxococcota bacterium]
MEATRRILRRWRTIVVVYSASLLFGLPFAVVLGIIAHRFGGYSMLVTELARAESLPILADFVVSEAAHLTTWATTVALASLGFAVLSVFINGAVLATSFESSSSGSTRTLIVEGSRVFLRVGGLAIVAILTWVLILAPAFAIMGWLLGTFLDEWASEPAVLTVRWMGWALVALLAAWAKGTTDAMRAVAIVQDERRIRVSVGRGLKLAVKSPGSVVMTVLPFILGMVVLTLTIRLIDPSLSKASHGSIACSFFLHQAAAFGRAALRVAMLDHQARWVCLHGMVSVRAREEVARSTSMERSHLAGIGASRQIGGHQS